MDQLKSQTVRSKRAKDVTFTALIFVAFAVLVYLFPYSGDDWAWGTQIGLDRLAVWFRAYNGRYLGNLLELALTRSELLNMLVSSTFFTAACFLPRLYSGSKSFTAYLMGGVMFLLMPKDVFVQSVVWTAGFSNYIPPIVLTMIYFVFIKNIFDEKKPEYRPWIGILSAVIGFSSTLFMENVTLFVVAISALIIFYSYLRFKKLFFVHVMHLAGSVIGAVVMFTNAAYLNIAQGDDFYRETAADTGIVDTVLSNSMEIFRSFFSGNITGLVILSVLCAVLCLVFVKGSADRVKNLIAVASICINVFSLMIIYFRSKFVHWMLFYGYEKSSLITVLFFIMIAAVYFASVVVCIFICVECEKTRYKNLLLLVSIPVLIAPLAVVSPIGPRCFFPPYLMLMGVCVSLFVYLKDKLNWSSEVHKGIALSMVAVCITAVTFLLSIYSSIHYFDVIRSEYAVKQAEAGNKNVIICNLPYPSYVWTGNPDEEPWDTRYKLFYGIDKDVTFEFVTCEEFKEFVRNFE